MGTTADKLEYLQGTKAAIKQAIVNKGVAVPDGTTFREYATKISAIQDVGSLPTQGAKTVTPTTTEQVAVASGRYTTGDVKVAGDANLKAENIAEGVSIFGVTGTHSGGTQLESVSLSVNITYGLWSNLYYYSIVDGYTTVSYTASYDVTDCLKDSIVVFETSADTDIEVSGDYAGVPIGTGAGRLCFVCRGNVEIDVTATGPF